MPCDDAACGLANMPGECDAHDLRDARPEDAPRVAEALSRLARAHEAAEAERWDEPAYGPDDFCDGNLLMVDAFHACGLLDPLESRDARVDALDIDHDDEEAVEKALDADPQPETAVWNEAYKLAHESRYTYKAPGA